MANLEDRTVKKRSKRSGLVVSLATLALALNLTTGCTTTQKGALTGSAIGASIGAIIGHQSDETAEGAALGGIVGYLSGASIGKQMETKYCPACGTGYIYDVDYCPKDGRRLQYKKW